MIEKFAFIELSSISLKLSILKVSQGHTKVIEEVIEQVRIGRDIEEDELIKPKDIQNAIITLKLFRKLCDTYGVTKIIAFSHNILSRAKNQKSFIEEVYNNTGINFTILTKEEENKCIYNAIVNSVDVSKGYIISIGNTSSNIMKFNRRSVLSSFVLPIGAVSLADQFEGNQNADAMIAFVKESLQGLEICGDEGESVFVGVGSTFTSLGVLAKKISKYSLDMVENYVIAKEIFEKTFDFVKGLDLDKSKKLKGISEERADSLLSGLCILKAFNEKLGMGDLLISGAQIEDGIMYNCIGGEIQEKFNDMLGFSLDTIREFDGFDLKNHKNVYTLASILFKQLKVMHKLPRAYVKPLRIASYLYDIGKTINSDNFSKHGFYAILNSKISGATQKEILLAAFICLCQNLDDFNLAEWVRYKDILTEDDLDAVRKLGIIVSLAAKLDSSKKGIVEDISCDILGDSVIMKTIVKEDPTFEIMQGMKVASNYKKVFKKFLQII